MRLLGSMLNRKMLRDIYQNKSQFVTIFLMVLIGIMVYVGVESYMSGMINARDRFNEENNIQDLNVIGKFTKEDLDIVKDIDGVLDAELKLEVLGIDALDSDKTYLINFIEDNNISKFYVIDGVSFDKDKKGVWLDNFYALENGIKVNDVIKFKYNNIVFEEKVLGLINVPDHIYDVKDERELIPNRKTYGFIYMSYKELSDNIFYNYIMVDVDNDSNKNHVKNIIEDRIDNAQGVIDIADTSSYQMYQGEIDEAKAYIGVFSGLFLFIAMLCVITTMTRVVKNQRAQIGILKSLGFSKRKIHFHYIKYGLFVSLIGVISGIILGRYFIGNVFLNLEMSFFEVPNGVAVIKGSSYVMAMLTVLCVCLITYFACFRELKRDGSQFINKSFGIASKGLFNNLPFGIKWNIRDILRNKFRTITAFFGVIGCTSLIVCAFGMLNSMDNFIKLQFDDLYNFNYKLTINSDASYDDILSLEKLYGNSTSQSLGIEIKDKDGNRVVNNVFINDSYDLVRFKDNDGNYIKIDKDDGVYVTYKMAQINNYKLGDEITWHIMGSKDYYTSVIVGFNKDPQNQNVTMTRAYFESLGIEYHPDSLYTNSDLSGVSEIENIELIQNRKSLKDSMKQILSMMQEMIIIIIVLASVLGGVIIYNMGILSYSEKKYQFATLKVLGFRNKKIRSIFIEQNLLITVFAIIFGLPCGYYLTKIIFVMCLDDNFDFGVKINISTYLFATIGTFIVSYITSRILSRKINKIDMVSSLKTNE